jgi:translation initiation factor IF-3
VPVPRRFDRRPPERDTTRINERIRVPEVRLIDDEGKQVGVLKTADALAFAQERELDLVEVAPEARPPVCRVLDYSKYKYEQAQKLKQARKHQQQITVREIKFRPKIAEHDYDTKKHHVERFLRHKDKVKVTIMFRGREVTHPERGTAILDRLAEELSELGVVEQRPMQEGRNMTMMMAPSKAVLTGRVGADGVIEDAEGVEAVEGAESSGSAAGATAVESPNGAAEAEAGASESAAETESGESESAADAGADVAETDTDAPENAPEPAADASSEAGATPVPEEGQESEGAAANTAVP